MQRLTLVALLVALTLATLFAALFAALPAAASDSAIDLRIVYRASATAAPKVTTLHCDPPHGTAPSPVVSCRRLRAIGPTAFAPTPHDRVCTQIAGGPMTAIVTGRYGGRTIWTRLTQRDGCAIARWNLVSFLLPAWKSGRPIGG